MFVCGVRRHFGLFFWGVWEYVWEVFGSVLEGVVWNVVRFLEGKHKGKATY